MMPSRNDMRGSGSRLPDVAGRDVFVFDWDGTLFDSMAVKLQSFSRVVTQYLVEAGAAMSPEHATRLYREHSGKPRREIFAIVGRACGVELTETDFRTMSDTLTMLNHGLLAGAALFPDALALLSRLLEHGRTACISSSVPQHELDHFVDLKLPGHLRARLGGVFGSAPGFGKGRAHLDRIMHDHGAGATRILAIGDDQADHALSRAAGIDCILVNRDGRDLPARIPAVRTLDELCKLIK